MPHDTPEDARSEADQHGVSSAAPRSVRLNAPPRRLTFLAAVTARFGPAFAFGWLWLAFCSFTWILVCHSELVGQLEFALPTAQVEGRVRAVHPAGATENGHRVWATEFVYTARGTRYAGVSFALGAPHAVGDEVPVEALTWRPDRARISGMRSRRFAGWVALFVLIFPLAGLAMVFPGVRRGRRYRWLLQHGILGRARCVRKRDTGYEANGKGVHELHFELVLRPEPTVSYRSSALEERVVPFSVKTSNPGPLEDDDEEPCLYDPERPERVALIDELPSELSFEGDVRGGTKWALVLPALALGTNAAVIWFA